MKVSFTLVAIFPTVTPSGGARNTNGLSIPNVSAGGVAIAYGCFAGSRQMAQHNLLQINMNFLQQRHFEYCTLLMQSAMFPLATSSEMHIKAAREKMACQLQQYTSMVIPVSLDPTTLPVPRPRTLPAPLLFHNIWRLHKNKHASFLVLIVWKS